MTELSGNYNQSAEDKPRVVKISLKLSPDDIKAMTRVKRWEDESALSPPRILGPEGSKAVHQIP